MTVRSVRLGSRVAPVRFPFPINALSLRYMVRVLDCSACGAASGVDCKIYPGDYLPEGCALHTARIMSWLTAIKYNATED